MFRITRDPSSGSSIQCLAKITVMVLSNQAYFTHTCTTHKTITYIYSFLCNGVVSLPNYLCLHRASMTNKTLYCPTDAQIYNS